MPWVKEYKYLGIYISCGGGWTRQISHMIAKLEVKTLEIVSWCRSHDATLEVAKQLWDIYVLRAAVFGAAMLDLSASNMDLIDCAHRQCGRKILAFARTAPNPCILAELGWKRLSVEVQGEKIRLFGRLLGKDCKVVQCILEASAQQSSLWTVSAAALAAPWCQSGMPHTGGQWKRICKQWATETAAQDANEIYNQCQAHNGLRH